MSTNGFEPREPVEDRTSRVHRDPRAERTRRQIFFAVRELMADRTAVLTVADVVSTAGISRSSFYAHFSNLDELAAELLRVTFAEIGASGIVMRREDLITGRSAARIGYARLVAHLVENFPLYSMALQFGLARDAYDEVVESYATSLVQSIITLEDVPEEVDVAASATYIAGGVMTLIGAWLRGRIDVSDDELVEQLVDLLPTWLSEPSIEKTRQ